MLLVNCFTCVNSSFEESSFIKSFISRSDHYKRPIYFCLTTLVSRIIARWSISRMDVQPLRNTTARLSTLKQPIRWITCRLDTIFCATLNNGLGKLLTQNEGETVFPAVEQCVCCYLYTEKYRSIKRKRSTRGIFIARLFRYTVVRRNNIFTWD